MPYELLVAILPLVAGASPIAGWLVGLGRRPCPHCGRRASRTVVVISPIGPIAPRDLAYTCNACGGAMRYARRPNGEEFLVPIASSEGDGS